MIDIKRTALELALDLERRGSLEGHYIWSDMLINSLTNAYHEGYRDATNGVPKEVEKPQNMMLEEREFALAYAIEKCLDTKLDSAEFRAVREACKSALENISFNSYAQGWNAAIAQINNEVYKTRIEVILPKDTEAHLKYGGTNVEK